MQAQEDDGVMFLRKVFGGRSKKNNNASSLTQFGAEQGVDVEMNYCPECGDEYRPDIDTCPACSVSLISGAEKLDIVERQARRMASRSMEILPGAPMSVIKKGPINDIKALKNLLAAQIIPSIIAGDDASCSKGCCGGPEMFLQVREEDVEEALAVMSQDFIKSTALESHDLSNGVAVFDHLAKEVACPACGCRFSPTVGACPECGLCFE